MSMEKSVRDWHERMVDLEFTLGLLDSIVGGCPESRLRNNIWAVAGGYMAALDAAYSIGGWLEWWWVECELGENPMGAKLQGETEPRIVTTIDDLVALLIAEHAAQEVKL